MTPTKRNEITLSILSQLRKRGAPSAQEPVSLDMGFGEETAEELDAYGKPLPRKKRRVKPEEEMDEIQDPADGPGSY